jgi:transcription elongation factor Elf1
MSCCGSTSFSKEYKLQKGFKECPKCNKLTSPLISTLLPNNNTNITTTNRVSMLKCEYCKHKFAIDLPKEVIR